MKQQKAHTKNGSLHFNNKVLSIMILSTDSKSINTLCQTITSSEKLNPTIEIFHASTSSMAIMFAEENELDIIVVDYSTSLNNTLTFLEYFTNVSTINKDSCKIVLTEDFNHIEESRKCELLRFANKVLSKTANYFNIESIWRELLVSSPIHLKN